ncbi:ABC transporter permease [Spirochaeta africana]|uniref:ABC-type multidrug transport system, permease component n=1 Tax=Spirochaeta africana (strain ATCC 700263 / DSM 8902 / Z-7692) TaxID=889378 RepID=H9UG87_SPIAZ|nr:ABC transporter permease [Spirochaeta africana]AFG36530.1 ABC-type multidrug transport system, permease component [Spirochaeta africana DSM 8902]
MKGITIHIRRILRNKLIIGAAAVIPVVMLLLGGRAGDMLPGMAVINQDGGPLAGLVVESLAQSYRVEQLSADEVEEQVRRGGLEYVLEIPTGFGAEVLAARTPQLAGTAVNNPHSALHVREAVEQVTRPALVLASSLQPETEQQLAAALQQVQQGPFRVEQEIHSRNGELSAANANGFLLAMNLFTMIMLLMGLYGGINLMRDRRSGTVMRAAAAPAGLRGYVGGLLAALMAVQLLQVALTTAAAGLVFPDIRLAVLARSFGVMSLFAMTSLAFGVALAGVAKSMNQLGVLGSIFIFPMAMLGGSFWPIEIMPQQLQRISVLMPNYWAGQAIQLSLAQAGLQDFLLPIAILGAYAALLFVLGSWKRDQVTSGREMRE